jgi:hypothetical protein
VALSSSDGHPLANDPLHAQQPDPEGVLDELAGPDAPVAEMVDVVLGMSPRLRVRWPTIAAMSSRVIIQHTRLLHAEARRGGSSFCGELVAADPTEVVATEAKNRLSTSGRALSPVGGSPGRSFVDLDEGLGWVRSGPLSGCR